ncbi:MAG: GNAT family N-acetyltransferase [Phenylobacterium sp.]|uniref:GNAT family N-acetyltransferase n=1 Tax=Phenylobacterium sp. TaxID=1871053 RepID=UPI0039193CCD
MTLRIVHAVSGDLDWLLAHDVHVSADWVRRCLDQQEYLLAWRGASPDGFLRFSRFWGRVPYLEMIQVEPRARGAGVGRALVAAWEAQMKAQGAAQVMTSAVADEPGPQAFHRANGYEEAGALRLNGVQATPEVFFTKAL